MGSRNARRERQAGKGQVRNAGRRVWSIHSDISVAAARRDSEILRAADVIDATASREGEDTAVIGLALVLEGQGALDTAGAVRRPIQGLVPAPQIHTSRHPPDGGHIAAAVRAHTIT